MTNKQAVKWLKAYLQDTPFQMEQYEQAFEMAIKALSQEPTRDIEKSNFSQEQYLLDTDTAYRIGYEQGKKDGRCKGKWIDYRDDGFVECPFCGHATNCEDDIDELHYCFYCGAKMESEDKE